MRSLKEKIKRICTKDYFPFIVVLALYLCLHIFFKCKGDDSVLREQYKSLPLSKEKGLILHDYFHWSSRIIVNCLIHLLLRVKQYVWAAFDIGIIYLLINTLSKLFAKENKRKVNIIIACLFVIYPFYQMGSAGWVATTVTYLWTLTLGLFSFIPLKKVNNNEKISKTEYFLYSLALIFGANQEQMSIIILVVYTLFVIYYFINKKKNWYIIFQTILSYLSFAFIMTTPGNAERKARELLRFLDYNSLSFLNKVEMSFSATMYDLIFKFNYLYILFTILLFVVILRKYKKLSYAIIGAIPFISSGATMFVAKVGFKYSTEFNKLFQVEGRYGLLNAQNYSSIVPYLEIFLMCINICSVMVALYMIYENIKDSLYANLIFLLGLATRVALGFSPTIWASGERTYIFFYFAIIILSIMMYDKCLREKIFTIKEDKVYRILLILFSVLVFLYDSRLCIIR